MRFACGLVFLLGLSSLYAGEARPHEADAYARVGRWLRLNRYDFINPERGLVLRIHEMHQNAPEDNAWGVYLVDLRAKTSQALCRLDKQFVKTAEDGIGIYHRVCKMELSLSNDKLWLGTMVKTSRTRDLRHMQHPTYILYEIDVKSEKQRQVLAVPPPVTVLNWQVDQAGSRVSFIARDTSNPLAGCYTSLLASLNDGIIKYATMCPGTSVENTLSFAMLRDGTGIASFLGANTTRAKGPMGQLSVSFAGAKQEELSLYRPNSNRVAQVQGPPYTYACRLTSDYRGDGVLALCSERLYGEYHKTENEKACFELWSAEAGIKNWKKLGELPPVLGFGDICPSANGKSAYVVTRQERGNRIDEDDNGTVYYYDSHSYFHELRQFIVFELEFSTGALKTVWKRDDLERIFYAGLENANKCVNEKLKEEQP